MPLQPSACRSSHCRRRASFLRHDHRGPMRPLPRSDALADPAYRAANAVADDSGIRFYAGVPLRDLTDTPMGTLCCIDAPAPAPAEDQNQPTLPRWPTSPRSQQKRRHYHRNRIQATHQPARPPRRPFTGAVIPHDPRSPPDHRLQPARLTDWNSARRAGIQLDSRGSSAPLQPACPRRGERREPRPRYRPDREARQHRDRADAAETTAACGSPSPQRPCTIRREPAGRAHRHHQGSLRTPPGRSRTARPLRAVSVA